MTFHTEELNSTVSEIIVPEVCREPENFEDMLVAKASRRVTYTDAYGAVWVYLFDSQGNKLRETNSGPDGIVREHDYNYDKDGHVIGARDADGTKTCYIFNGNNLETIRRYATPGLKNTLGQATVY
jgi:hypothetical protein